MINQFHYYFSTADSLWKLIWHRHWSYWLLKFHYQPLKDSNKNPGSCRSICRRMLQRPPGSLRGDVELSHEKNCGLVFLINHHQSSSTIPSHNFSFICPITSQGTCFCSMPLEFFHGPWSLWPACLPLFKVAIQSQVADNVSLRGWVLTIITIGSVMGDHLMPLSSSCRLFPAGNRQIPIIYASVGGLLNWILKAMDPSRVSRAYKSTSLALSPGGSHGLAGHMVDAVVF